MISLLELVTVTKVTDLSRRLMHHTSKQAVHVAVATTLEEQQKARASENISISSKVVFLSWLIGPRGRRTAISSWQQHK